MSEPNAFLEEIEEELRKGPAEDNSNIRLRIEKKLSGLKPTIDQSSDQIMESVKEEQSEKEHEPE